MPTLECPQPFVVDLCFYQTRRNIVIYAEKHVAKYGNKLPGVVELNYIVLVYQLHFWVRIANDRQD